MSKLKPKEQFVDPERGPLVSPRFVVALVLMLAGIAWIAYYYIGVRAPDGFDKETLQPSRRPVRSSCRTSATGTT